MTDMTEIRWHARAGQGAKTAAQILALALLRDGKGVQAFPEYGPERRGAPLRAFTRVADRPIRRHDTITDPNLVVVLEPSLVHEAGIADGLQEDGLVARTARRGTVVTRLTEDEAREMRDLGLLILFRERLRHFELPAREHP